MAYLDEVLNGWPIQGKPASCIMISNASVTAAILATIFVNAKLIAIISVVISLVTIKSAQNTRHIKVSMINLVTLWTLLLILIL
ncbi:MAG: hypothetical protein KGH67_00270 [Candidatus Micrarchaeota archaeon]|nr:hypothetical protein [Candidatus Micrarchaeota archaeon]MDE1858947.1 hypothetical protein [Candidatus Micrarchaeota archaeon]